MIGYKPWPYQEELYDFCMDRLYFDAVKGKPSGSGVLLDPGMGKSSVFIWLCETLRDMGVFTGGLLVAPKKVCETTWISEPDKWGSDLKMSFVTGTPAARMKALATPADLHVINPEGIMWLQKNSNMLPAAGVNWNMLCVDESTKFKNWGAKRTKALKKLLPMFDMRMILTGTPAPNGYQDLFSQIYLLDDGATLGKTIGYFRNRYMRRGGYLGRQWTFREECIEQFQKDISPLTLRMDAEDHLDMPSLVYNKILVNLPPTIAKAYKRLEDELFMAIDGGEDLIASSAGAKYAMCRGVANGGGYVNKDIGDREMVHIHDTKVEALADLVDELGGKPVIVAYQYHHDLERIQKRFPNAPAVRGGTKNLPEILRDWQAGKIQVLCVQPQAMSHGVDGLQKVGNDIVWMGMTDQLEIYKQFNARLYRQGVIGGHVRIHHILANDTIDLAMYDRTKQKDDDQNDLLQALKLYRDN